MNIASKLPEPLNRFVIDVPKNTYYDFELAPDSTYPLKGVTYPVDYGNIPGYTTEDGHELDLFVGLDLGGAMGYLVVERGEHTPNEHKFFVGLAQEELNQVLSELNPVLVTHAKVSTVTELITFIERYKDR